MSDDDEEISKEDMRKFMESEDLLKDDSDDSEEGKFDKEVDPKILNEILKADANGKSDSDEDIDEEEYKKILLSANLNDSDEELKSPKKPQVETQRIHPLMVVDRHERKNKLEEKPPLTLHLEDNKKYGELQVNRMKYTRLLKIYEAFTNADIKKANVSPTCVTVL